MYQTIDVGNDQSKPIGCRFWGGFLAFFIGLLCLGFGCNSNASDATTGRETLPVTVTPPVTVTQPVISAKQKAEAKEERRQAERKRKAQVEAKRERKQVEAKREREEREQARREREEVQQAEATHKQQVRQGIGVYLGMVGGPGQEIAKGLGEASKLCGQVGDEPTLLSDNSWKLRVIVALSRMQVGSRSLKQIEPVPDEMRPMHELVLQFANESYSYTEDLGLALDEKDNELAKSAIKRAENLRLLSRKMAIEVEQAKERHGL